MDFAGNTTRRRSRGKGRSLEKGSLPDFSPSLPSFSPVPQILYRYLIIGYGTTLGSDDGVGPKVAEAVVELGLPGVKTISCDLVTPELAEPISPCIAASPSPQPHCH